MSKMDRLRKVSLSVGLFVSVSAFLGFIVTTSASGGRPKQIEYYVDLYKFTVAMFCIAFGLWWFYGSIAHKRGYLKTITPPGNAPRKVAVVYFSAGFSIMLASFRIFTRTDVWVLFGTVLSYTSIFGIAVGLGVYYYVRAEMKHGDEYTDGIGKIV